MVDHVHMMLSIPPKYSVAQVIGSARREGCDHIVVPGDDHARRLIRRYLENDERSRTHLSLVQRGTRWRQA